LGFELSASKHNLNEFVELLETTLSNIRVHLKDHQWIDFISAPISLHTTNHNSEEMDGWNQIVGNWWNYCYLGKKLVSSLNYAFAAPSDFIEMTGIRSFSWGGYWYVSRKRDVAVQLFAHVYTTHVERQKTLTFRQTIFSQFVPWQCPNELLEELNLALNKHNFVFSAFNEAITESSLSYGVIHGIEDEPNNRYVRIPLSWTDLEEQSTQAKLKDFAKDLPGQRAGGALEDIIFGRWNSMVDAPVDSLLTAKNQYIYGVPIDHSRRLITMHRFRIQGELDAEYSDTQLKKCCDKLIDENIAVENIDYGIEIIDDVQGTPVYAIYVSWKPKLNESALESIERISPHIISVFDRIMPPLSAANTKGANDTLYILDNVGQMGIPV
jgi:hypothetical protein